MIRHGRFRRMTQISDTEIQKLAEARHRELAVEHLLFGTLRFVASRHPELIGELEGSLTHLWDKASDGSRDDEAVREVARRFIRSLKKET